ncbi:hypothetical protein Tco_0456404 [Tanacetum coccineum]
MITTTSRIEDKKPSKLILPPMDMLENFPCVRDVDYIHTDLASAMTGCNRDKVTQTKYSQKQQGHKESILKGWLLLLETTLEDIQLSSESSSI